MKTYEIITYSISTQLESDLSQKQLKETELADIYTKLAERKKKQHSSVIALVVAAAIFAVLVIVGCIVGELDLGVTLACVGGFLVLIAVGGYLAWYNFEGKISKKWNKLLKENYHSVCDKFKL